MNNKKYIEFYIKTLIVYNSRRDPDEIFIETPAKNVNIPLDQIMRTIFIGNQVSEFGKMVDVFKFPDFLNNANTEQMTKFIESIKLIESNS